MKKDTDIEEENTEMDRDTNREDTAMDRNMDREDTDREDTDREDIRTPPEKKVTPIVGLIEGIMKHSHDQF